MIPAELNASRALCTRCSLMQRYGLTARPPATAPSQPLSASAKPTQRRRPNGSGSGTTVVWCRDSVVSARCANRLPAGPTALLAETVKTSSTSSASG